MAEILSSIQAHAHIISFHSTVPRISGVIIRLLQWTFFSDEKIVHFTCSAYLATGLHLAANAATCHFCNNSSSASSTRQNSTISFRQILHNALYYFSQ